MRTKGSVVHVIGPDDAEIVPNSVNGLIAVIVIVFDAAYFTGWETNMETMLLRTPDQTSPASLLVIEAAGQMLLTDVRGFIPHRYYPRRR